VFFATSGWVGVGAQAVPLPVNAAAAASASFGGRRIWQVNGQGQPGVTTAGGGGVKKATKWFLMKNN